MKELIEALQILIKYGDPKYPTSCDHDILYIMGIRYSDVSEDDRKRLGDLGFHEGEWDNFYSTKFGAA